MPWSAGILPANGTQIPSKGRNKRHTLFICAAKVQCDRPEIIPGRFPMNAVLRIKSTQFVRKGKTMNLNSSVCVDTL
jgi:hypothetical protein